MDINGHYYTYTQGVMKLPKTTCSQNGPATCCPGTVTCGGGWGGAEREAQSSEIRPSSNARRTFRTLI